MKLSLVKRNVFANLFGTGLVTVLTVLITPLQINILGMEAYGVVGFIATLQAMFAAFDLGLSSTLTRELAADVSLDKRGSQALLSTAATTYWCSAALIGFLISLFADSISHWWFNAEKLSSSELIYSLRVIALYLALRWPAALYVGILSGLQRMEVLNVVKVLVTIVRLAIGILVLLQWRTLSAFLLWTAFSAIFEVMAYGIACKRVIPSLSLRLGFSIVTLKRVWKFSASMNALAILAIVITQFDRLAISKMLPLSVLGGYNLAYTTASGIPLVIAAIGSAVFPWFTEAQNGGSLALLRKHYASATWGMLFPVGLLASILIFYGHILLALWVNPRVAEEVTSPTAFLVIGFWLSAVVSNAYNVSVARGLPQRPLSVAVFSVIPYGVVITSLVYLWGARGAALGWVILNVSNTFFLLPYIHSRVLEIDTKAWLLETVVPLIALAFCTFLPLKLMVMLIGRSAGTVTNLAALSLSVIAYLGVGLYFSSKARLQRSMPTPTEVES